MKQIFLFILLIVAAFAANAQIGEYANVRAVRLINGDVVRAGLNNGTIYYDLIDNEFKFRQNGVWLTLGEGGGGTGITDGNKGDITVTGTGANWFINNQAVTFPKFVSVPTQTIIGRTLAGTGPVDALTPAQINLMLPVFTHVQKGVVPISGGGTTNYLRADGVWAAPPGTGGAGSGTTETASNGLVKTGDDIRLGGLINQNTHVSNVGQTDKHMYFSDGTGAMGRGSDIFFYGGYHIAYGNYTGRTSAFSDMWSDASGLHFTARSSTGNIGTLLINGNNTTYTDNKTSPTGIQYATSGYETTPTTLVTRLWVEQAIAAAGGGGGTGITDGNKGNITVSNAGATWTINNDVVTYARMQNVTGLRFLGRSSSTAGDPQELTGTTATSLLDQFTTTAKGVVPSSPGGTTAFLRADGTWTVPPTGSSPGIFTSTVSGIVPASGGGTAKYLRSDATWANFPGVFTSTVNGLVPLSGGGTTKFLRADGTWQVISGGATYSNFTRTVAGLVPAPGGSTFNRFMREDGSWSVPAAGPIGADAVTYSQMQNVNSMRIMGRIAAGAGDMVDLTGAEAATILPNFTSSTDGLVPASGGGTGKYLDADGVWKSLTVVASGTYTPTAVVYAGAASSVTVGPNTYQRIGNIVTVYGRINFGVSDPIAGLIITLTLPISTTFTAINQLNGTGHAQSPGKNTMMIETDHVFNQNKAILKFAAGTGVGATGTGTYHYQYQYQIL